MELELQPDLYEPDINDDGEYIDKSVKYMNFTNGFRCPCNTKTKKYVSASSFRTHLDTKMHVSWLQQLNMKKKNIYTNSLHLQELCDTQKVLIGELSNMKQQLLLKIEGYEHKILELEQHIASLQLSALD